MSTKPKCIIIDGNSFMHRAFNSMPAFSNKAGFPTGTITGFLSMMTSVINKFKPEKLIVTFDAKGKNFRHDMYSEYKANRPPTPEDLALQFKPVKDIVSAWGYPIVSIPGVEADDVMATIAKIAEELGFEAIITTSDKDMDQVIGGDIKKLDTKDADKNPVPYGPEGVIERMGVEPKYIRDLLAIMGDTSDNVPGAVGVGKVTAAKWINQFGGVEDIIANADSIKGAYGQKFRDQIEQVRLSYRLVTIDDNVDLGLSFEDISGQKNEEALFGLIKEFELKKFQQAIGAKNTDAVELNIETIDLDNSYNNLQLEEVLSEIQAYKTCYIEFHQGEKQSILFLSSLISEKVYKVTITDDNREVLSQLLSSDITLTGNDVKQAIKILVSETGAMLSPHQKVHDTRLLNFTINGGRAKPASIEELNQIAANIEISELRVTYKLDTDKPQWKKIQLEELVEIKAQELMVAKLTFLSDEYNKYIGLNSLNKNYQLLPILAQMEIDGVLLDRDGLSSLKIELSTQLEEIEQEIFKEAGQEFNVGSAQQVKKVLFDDMKIPSKKQKTDEAVLSKLVKDHPIAAHILHWRSINKLITTYATGLTKRMTSNDLVHTTYYQYITKTGRLSSKDPNLQNIPINSKEGKKIREAFISPDGYKVLALDYSQIELRILAHLSGQPSLVKAFINNLDIHKATASDIFGTKLEDVTDAQRRSAKAINFSLIYGRGPKALAEELGITLKEAKDIIEAYFIEYDMVKPCMDGILEFAQANLYIETVTGRHVPTRDVNTSNKMAQVHAHLAAKNAPFQGSAADIIEEAMIQVAYYIFENRDKFDITLLMQVHDELVLLVKEEYAEEVSGIISSIMENAVKLDVPLVVDYKIGNNWLEAH